MPLGKRTKRGRVFQFFVNTALAQNESFEIVPEDQDGTARKYAPFDVVNVFNDSDETVQVDINNGTSTYRVATKTNKQIDSVEARSVTITNLSPSSTTANEVSVEFQSEEPNPEIVTKQVSKSNLLRKIMGMEA